MNCRGIFYVRGFSLIEVVVFVVVVSAAAVALMSALGRVVPRGVTAVQLTQASQLALERMELIVGQRAVLGYSSTALDPCPSALIPCTQLAGFTVAVAGVNPVVGWSGLNTNSFRQITVTVSNQAGAALASEVSVLANY